MALHLIYVHEHFFTCFWAKGCELVDYVGVVRLDMTTPPW